ncbi:type II toxin-antitoxin system prevent-host-death family antitoxin [bacterium]|nr:type II toxin-antitoxin system prevent-host-death family antitoxin [bacterium]
MKTVSAYDAKTHFSKLLRAVKEGERFVITVHGTEVATLAPVEQRTERSFDEVVADILEFRKTHSLKGLNVKELAAEGRD